MSQVCGAQIPALANRNDSKAVTYFLLLNYLRSEDPIHSFAHPDHIQSH